MKHILRLAALLCVGSQAFAGLSLVLTPGAVSSNVTDPNLPAQQAWRIEFQMHDWTLPNFVTNAGRPFDLNGVGLSVALEDNGYVRIFSLRDGTQCPDMSLADRRNILFRIQRDPVAMRFTCELWNHDGTGHQLVADTIKSIKSYTGSGAVFGSLYAGAQLGFLRVFKTLVPEGSRPPTTASHGTWSEYTFDGNTQDSSGNNHNGSFPGATYRTTPDQVPVSIPKTADAPSWSNGVSLRAGFPAGLDGTASFSLADRDDTVNYRWQQISGPSTLRWSDRSSPKPVIKGLIFGNYKLRLQVSDASGKTTTADLEVGAVATDDNGVVVHANPAADILFGPMIAFGKNPWPWADEMTLRSATVRKPYLDRISPPSWGTELPGTISYEPARWGQSAETTIASALQASDMSIRVQDASKLDLTSFPMIILVNPPTSYVGIEEMKICSVTGNVLNVCYDGRAWRAGQWLRVTAPQAWPIGTMVRQAKTKGTGTAFMATMCPAGPGEQGQPVTSAGTVRTTPGSTTLTGTGTTWSNSIVSFRVRIEGTHAGQPFVFFAGVDAVASAGQLTMSRAWPTDADPGTALQYSVLQQNRDLVRGWRRPDGTNGKQTTGVSACITDTDVYHNEFTSNFDQTQTGQTWGYAEGSWISDLGPNYYDEVLAGYAGYMRSGLNLFRDNARKIGDYWAISPYFDEGGLGVFPRRASITGLYAATMLDGRTGNWRTLRTLANSAVTNPFNGAILPNCDEDIRESAYSLSWLAMAALFDPVDTGSPTEPNQRSYWKAQLTRALARDNSCKGPNNEFPIVYWQEAAVPGLTLTNGSRTVKGTNIPQSLCAWVSSGTINVTRGSNAATGTNFSPNAKLSISAAMNGQPYLFMSEYGVTSSSSITLASPFDGDSGTYPYQIENDPNWLSFGLNRSDRENPNIVYSCQWVDSSTATLNRPWHGATGTYLGARNLLLGPGMQPFMAGIKTFAMKLAAQTDTGATARGYEELARGLANWTLNVGFDPETGGLHYGRGMKGCEPKLNPRLNCSFGLSDSEKQQSRMLNAEAQNALRVAYEANPTAEIKAFGDKFYGAQWGKLGGPYSDSVYLKTLENDNTWNYKWLGFLFGVGMAHQWPAVRLGGRQPADIRNATLTYSMAGAPGAVSARIAVTQPSGAEAVFACESSPCTVSVDARQGAHWYRISYLDSKGAVLTSSAPEILELR